MPRRSGPILILLSLVLAGAAAWIANRWVNARAATAVAPITTNILTASMDLPMGTKIEQRHLSSMEALVGKEPAGAFHDVSEVEGKVAKGTINSGQILMKSMFFENGEGGTLAAVVAKDKRAVTVRVDDVVGVAGFLLPGNRVDVVATRRTEHDDMIADTILSDIKVLAVDQTQSANSSEPVVVRAVTLEVTPDEAEILLKRKAAGSIQLTLRNPLDKSDTRHVYNAPQPVERKAPVRRVAEAPPSVTVIRGTTVGHDAAIGHDATQ